MENPKIRPPNTLKLSDWPDRFASSFKYSKPTTSTSLSTESLPLSVFSFYPHVGCALENPKIRPPNTLKLSDWPDRFASSFEYYKPTTSISLITESLLLSEFFFMS
jgi:hypothetical protein